MEQHTLKPISSRRFRFGRMITYALILCFFINSCLLSDKHIKKETFYIPKGVTGKIYILFNCKEGKPKKWINGRRLYEIPPSGVLKTQFKENTGYILYGDEGVDSEIKKYNEYAKFYYVDENNQPIQQINYSPFYAGGYKEYLKPKKVNVTGSNAVRVSGNGKEKYTIANYYLFKGKTLNKRKDYSEEQIKEDWFLIQHWKTFDRRKDSIR
ncbi:DUF6843 domain-containing protein [Tenacibaculum maritimum]|uniref:DUF6843 domain-containing protein n=1 Tax=Tenacibaculum maritimum TaxID=107401 RepID=UPI0012E4F77E|nr:hypothetical protein [Tenacibaculum maritimum]CAA0197284.1 conserved hypothetical protein [Tenacibaculum maritimum]CAA0230729.1 conserved hypothetical protein [Tenacibaculum maritimum]